MSGRVLVVDDDVELRSTLTATLEGDGFTAWCAGTGAQALGLLREQPVEVVLTDLRMAELDGLELCRRVREVKPGVPVIVMTGFGDMEAAVAAIRAGAYDFLAKPFEPEALRIALDRAVSDHRLRQRLGDLERRLEQVQPFDELLGESREMGELFDLLGRAAQTDTTVLITGETGTGKELVARALHRHSARADEPFVALNCAAVPEALLESELFGHVRGAFTDARDDRPGLFQRAHGGTVFLDEVGDMPPQLQAKLLRVLQERSVRPVGSDREVPVDVRLVAATHRDLETEVEAGTFRQDLLYRLNVIQLTPPPLRDRGNDVLLLAQHFLRQQTQRLNRAVEGITPEAAEKLIGYDWPGNVRELQNCIERAVALTRHRSITVEDLPPKVRDWEPRGAGARQELVSLAQVERRHVLGVLEAVGGNKARAASILRIGRKTLYRKLEQYAQAQQPSPPRSRQ